MNNQIRDNLISVIREKSPLNVNLTTYLCDTLNIGKESAYRRIRGEINFTFDEIATLSQNLNFSVDNIIGSKQGENALFNIHLLQKMDYFDIYVSKMLEYGRMFRESSEQMETKARMSIGTLPYFFYVDYMSLSKFRIYKWMNQHQKIEPNEKYVDFVLPEKILNAHKVFHQDIQKIQSVTVIMNNNVFWSVIKDIEYFYKRGLLSDEDIQALKKDLHKLLNTIEQMATTGKNNSGSKTDLYITPIDMEASYLHFEYGAKQFSQIRIFAISAIDSFDIGLCKIQKEWIESLKRYSVLISESGEVQRFEYINKQREYIDNINGQTIRTDRHTAAYHL